MIVEHADLPDVVVFRRVVHTDSRGWFSELWRETAYREAGVTEAFVQDNASVSRQNVLRGLHFQHPDAQGKLVSVLYGEAFHVIVDLRRGSPGFGAHLSFDLRGGDRTQIYVPAGFAQGVLALTANVVLTYKCTAYFEPSAARTVNWADPALGIEWPIRSPILSERDAAAPLLSELSGDVLPRYRPTFS